MKKLVLVLIFLISISFISGLCEEGQIDINIASLEELDGLEHVGPAVAGYIIGKRPFSSIEQLVEVNYISPGYLIDIKEQGLACVNVEEDEVEEENASDVYVEEQEPEEVIDEVIEEQEDKQIEDNEDEGTEIIDLTAKTIKTQDNKKNKSNYAIYGFVGFCVLLGILFIIKNKKYKNEFR
jgi:hypothetical protein